MDIFRSDLKEEIAVSDSDDQFYEEIEAPKFVDFTAPEHHRPDDKSWFCLRIGCDQQHEDVDPDALYRSFMLRVMAARSPNVRFQKSMSRQTPRSTNKCPQSAPAKSVKDRVSRLSTVTSIPVKLANTKLNHHPFCSLKETPIRTKPKLQPSTSERKALTAPRTRKNPSNNHEPFRSVKHQKAPAASVTKNSSIVKALFLGTPKKNDQSGKPLKLEVCDGMKKLKIGGTLKKHTPKNSSGFIAGGHIQAVVNKKKGGVTSSKSLKQKGNEPQGEDNGSTLSDCCTTTTRTNEEEDVPGSSMLIVKESQQSLKVESAITASSRSSDELEKNMAELEASCKGEKQAELWDNVAEFSDNKEKQSLKADTASYNSSEEPEKNMAGLEASCKGEKRVEVRDNVAECDDDNKENDSYSSNLNSSATNSAIENLQSLQSEATKIIPKKEVRAPSKKILERDAQSKTKRSTHPKPFRLRTDERGILKEANLEKRVQLEAQNGIAPVLGHVDGKQNPARTPRVRYVESRYATSIPKRHKLENKELGESERQSAKTALLTRRIPKAQSVRAAREVQASELRSKRALVSKTRVEVNSSSIAKVTCLKGERASTLAKANSQRVCAPKSRTRRPEVTIP